MRSSTGIFRIKQKKDMEESIMIYPKTKELQQHKRSCGPTTLIDTGFWTEQLRE